METKCKNCGYYNPEDQKCYYLVDQYIYFEGIPAQPEDAACEVWTPIIQEE